MIRHLLISIGILMMAVGNIHAQRYVPTDEGSKVQFRIVNHIVFTTTVNGYFKGLKGSILFNPNDLKASSVDVSVAVNTISTGISMRDNDLKKESYFNAEKYPVMHMRSKAITQTDKAGTYLLSADLTIKGNTKNISFPFTATLTNDGYMFKATFKINRKDFQVGDNDAIDNQLTVMLQVLAKKQ